MRRIDKEGGTEFHTSITPTNFNVLERPGSKNYNVKYVLERG